MIACPERAVPLYLATGWVALARSLPAVASVWLGVGCLIHTVGAIICVTNRPQLLPGRFSAHDLWPVFVLAGRACHFVLMSFFIALT